MFGSCTQNSVVNSQMSQENMFPSYLPFPENKLMLLVITVAVRTDANW